MADLRIDGQHGVGMPRAAGVIEAGLVYHALNRGNGRRRARRAAPADRGE